MSVTESVENKIIFGPIHSRRFGNSLGIDLSPGIKQCNFDCLYCELAPAATVDKQTEIVDVQSIIGALKAALNEHHNIDVITLTANGEPTLYPYLRELIDEIDKIKGNKETLILTNSATLTDENVFQTLLKLDQVKLSLDSVTPEVFKKIDRPHKGIDIAMLTCKVQKFAQKFTGRLYIEILFVRGLNDTKEEIAALNKVLKTLLHVRRIDLGTIDRPPAYPVEGISYGELFTIAHMFDASLPVHIASRTHAESCVSSYSNEEILNTLDKRPLTLEDIKLLFDAKSQERLAALQKSGEIVTQKVGNLEFYTLYKNLQRKRQKS